MPLLGFAVALATSTGAAPAVTVTVGRVIPRVACAEFEGQQYALYVPGSYTPGRIWPVVYCFDPQADALRAIERFVPGAERFGYIVAASHTSRNQDPEGAALAASAMLHDTARVLRIDPRRRYAAGFSGGAGVACAVAAALEFAGVIIAGAPMDGRELAEQGTFALFGAAGLEDFNYQRMRAIDEAFAERNRPHRFRSFAGRHEWLPTALATEALGWLDLQAMRTGLREPEPQLVEALYGERRSAAAAESDPLARQRALAALVEDFTGFRDVRPEQQESETLARSSAVKALLRAERRQRSLERDWLERLHAAAADARSGVVSRLRAPRLERWEPMDAGGMMGETSASAAMNPDSWLPDATEQRDPWDVFDRLLAEARRRGEKDVALRRVLNSVFVSYHESARAALEQEDYAAATEGWTVATRIHPAASDAQLELARVYALQGRAEEARGALEAAIAHGCTDTDAIEAVEHALAHPEEAVISLRPFVVAGRGILTTSFGLGLSILADPRTQRIREVVVRKVAERSDAELHGVKPGDRILAADGTSLETLPARFDRGSAFHRLFMRRAPGDSIRLKVATAEGAAVRSLTLTQRAGPLARDPFVQQVMP